MGPFPNAPIKRMSADPVGLAGALQVIEKWPATETVGSLRVVLARLSSRFGPGSRLQWVA